MDAIRRTSTLRRVATTASLAALLLVPGAAEAAKHAKSPVITKVSPLNLTVGDTLTITGHNFRKGKHANAVGFKREGAAVVFIKSDVSTKTHMYVKVSSKLEKVLYGGQPAVFHLRVLAKRFGKQYTGNKMSPKIRPRPETVSTGPTGPTGPTGVGPTGPTTTPAFDPAGPLGDCDGDGVLNKDESGDMDNDLLPDKLEEKIGTDSCKADTDGDGVTDAYEYKSAIDLNDDEYQSPNVAIPYPGARPYPNPLFKDADTDYDGDSLTLAEEFKLWHEDGGPGGFTKSETPDDFAKTHLSYSDGLQYSVYSVDGAGHRVPALKAAGYDKQADFLKWAHDNGYAVIDLSANNEPWWTVATTQVDIRDVNRDGALDGRDCAGQPHEVDYYDYDCDGYLSDDERDEDADGLTNFDETHGRLSHPSWWTDCYTQETGYPVPYEGTDLATADTDGDGIRDGADDQDHDDLPNMMELSRNDVSRGQLDNAGNVAPNGLNDTDGHGCTPADGLDPKTPNHSASYGKVNPFNPCDPDPNSRTCDRHPDFGTAADPNWWALN